MNRPVYWLIHVSLLSVIVYSRFDTAVISVALIILVFSNLGTSTSPYSAYSIFNKGCRYLLGEARADDFDRQLRNGPSNMPEKASSGESEGFLNIPSKYINRPCPCGSGLKAKKCHAKIRVGSRATSRKQGGIVEDYDTRDFEVLDS
jgi:hypothetical protein